MMQTASQNATYSIISLGGGVQSTVMALMAAQHELEPMPAAAIFADTKWEPPALYEHLDWISAQLPFPLVRVSQGDIAADLANGINSTGQQFFSVPVFVRGEAGRGVITKRQCTREYKIAPMRRWIRERLLGLEPGRRAQPGTVVEQWIGISTDEIQRARVGNHRDDPPWQRLRYPLIERDMSRTDCLAWFRARYPGRELRKSSCLGCPYHDDNAWRQLAAADPDLYMKVADVERRMRQSQEGKARFRGDVALHRSLIPLGEIDWTGMPRQLSFHEDCDGVCWT